MYGIGGMGIRNFSGRQPVNDLYFCDDLYCGRVGNRACDFKLFRDDATSYVRDVFLYDGAYSDERSVYSHRVHAFVGTNDRGVQSVEIFCRSDAIDLSQRQLVHGTNESVSYFVRLRSRFQLLGYPEL